MPENKENETNEPNITPSESHDEKDATRSEAGDPGRTPGKAEGEDDDEETS